MSGRFSPPKSYLAVGLAALLLGSCGGDELTDSIRPNMADRKNEGGAKIASLMRVAGTTAASGDLPTAAGLYRRAHELDPYLIEPLVKLGQTLAALGAHEQAAETFRTAIDLANASPDEKKHLAPEAAHGLGNALIAMNQPKAALTQFEHAMMERDDPRTYSGIGVAYDMLGQHGAAQAYYRTGLEAHPNNPGLLNNLGLSLAVTGKHDDAIKVLEKAAALPKSTSRNRLNLALAYGLAGDNERAAQIARVDLDEASVRSNLAYYETLRAMRDKASVLKAIGTHTDGFYIDPDKPDVRNKKMQQSRRRSAK